MVLYSGSDSRSSSPPVATAIAAVSGTCSRAPFELRGKVVSSGATSSCELSGSGGTSSGTNGGTSVGDSVGLEGEVLKNESSSDGPTG